MKKIVLFGIKCLFIIILFVFILNIIIVLKTKDRIINMASSKSIKNVDCILVLGAGIWGDKPSPILQDRLDKAIELYNEGIAKKIIMSGDNGQNGYDEVNVMKNYAIDNGVPSEDIFMDHAGFSTYDSIYRAKKIFELNKIIVVTQKYHLYRALYLAGKMDIDAYGVYANPKEYAGATFREAREVLARGKDFIKAIFKPSSKYLGEVIPVTGNGDITNDKPKKRID